MRRGERRLENWGRWAREFDSALGYPQRAPWARYYQPDAGDVWQGISEGASRAPVDEDDAERVEAFVRQLPRVPMLAVRSVYLRQDAPVVTCTRLGCSRERLDALLEQVNEDCGLWR